MWRERRDHLVPQRRVVRIQRLEVRRLGVDGLDHGFGQIFGARPAEGPVVGHHAFGACRRAEPLKQGDLVVRIEREAVDRNHHRNVELADILDVLFEIGEALLQRLEILAVVTENGLDVDLGHLQVVPELAEHVADRFGVGFLGHAEFPLAPPGAPQNRSLTVCVNSALRRRWRRRGR